MGPRLVCAAALGIWACAPQPASPARAASEPALAAPSRTGAAPRPDSAPAGEPSAPSCAPLELPLPELVASKIDVPIPPIDDPDGRALHHFYDKLARLARGQARDHVRIAVYGDSNMTEDLISGQMRRWLQARFGDGGHGYVAIGKPWTWYLHQDVVHDLDPKTWRHLAVTTHAAHDQSYGFAGIAAEATASNARAWVETAAASAPVGRAVGRFDVFHLKKPRGAGFEVRIDGQSRDRVATAGELGVGFTRYHVPDGPHRIGFVAEAGVRLLGVALERETPGVVVDSLGVGGANEALLARMRPEIVRQALAHRPYDLVIFLTGSTEDVGESHERALRARLDLHRAVLPEASILVMSPIDFAYGGVKRPRPSKRIVRLGRHKQQIAHERGVAFWDFHGAMGGELSIVKFAHAGLASPDLAHLTPEGATYMARRLLFALLTDLRGRVANGKVGGC